VKSCLDTRFFFTYYSPESPDWAKRIVESGRTPGTRLVASTVTITELVSLMTPTVGRDAVDLRIRSAKEAGVNFIPPSEEIASRAGEFALKDGDLPLADAIIAATAIDQTGGRVYTDDPHFRKISGMHIAWGKA
jgi:predicted nucleic acid-binding protein